MTEFPDDASVVVPIEPPTPFPNMVSFLVDGTAAGISSASASLRSQGEKTVPVRQILVTAWRPLFGLSPDGSIVIRYVYIATVDSNLPVSAGRWPPSDLVYGKRPDHGPRQVPRCFHRREKRPHPLGATSKWCKNRIDALPTPGSVRRRWEIPQRKFEHLLDAR